MTGTRIAPPWSVPGWMGEVRAWVVAALDEVGLTVAGPMEPRLRPWSAVLRVPTSGGRCWFKTTAPGMADDAGLTPLLAVASPDLVLAPIASDRERRWMLLPDGGERLREHVPADTAITYWQRILPAYAELQLAVERRAADLLTAGALDRRPERLPALLSGLLAEPEWLLDGKPDGLAADERAHLQALVPRLAEAAAALGSVGIGASIQHDDLHDGNVVVSGTRARIVDWGDAGLAHPFGTLLVTLNGIADALGVADDAPELTRLTDAYLEPFASRLPLRSLRRLVPVARWSAMVGRALAWRAALPYATAAERAEWEGAIPAWLRELLQAEPPT